MSNAIESVQFYDSKPLPKLAATSGSISLRYSIFKCILDKVFAILSMPYVICFGLMLFVLNPFFNPGPLLFRQQRMGLDGRCFTMWKFRTMSSALEQARAHDAPLEVGRITVFAGYLRKFHFDELPNFINVLVGDMSLVGPRPDAWDHSTHFAKGIPYYRHRFRVKPGVTGLAQVCGGYAETTRAIERKARFDHFYVKKSCIKLEIYIIWRTFVVVFTGFGGK